MDASRTVRDASSQIDDASRASIDAAEAMTGSSGSELFQPRAQCASDRRGLPLRPAGPGGAGYRLEPMVIHDSASIDSVAIGDVTGDGRADVVVVAPLDPVRVYTQGVDGRLRKATELQYPPANPAGLKLAELSGDEQFDIVVFGTTVAVQRTELTVFVASGGTTFSKPRTIAADFVQQFEVRDMTADGAPEIVGRSGDRIGVFERRGSGELWRSFDVVLRSTPGTPAGWCLDDVTGDGHVDLITALSGTGAEGLAVQAFDPAKPDFAAGDVYKVGTGHNIGCTVGDFNHDGRNDVAVTEDVFGGDDHYWILEQDASGKLRDSVELGSYGWSGVMTAGDLNHDGRQDLVRLHSLRLSFLLQTDSGLGEPQYQDYPDSSTESQVVVIGDVNCDGCPDIVGANVTGLVVLYGQGCAG